MAAGTTIDILSVAEAAGLPLYPIQGGRQYTTRCWMCDVSHFGADVKAKGHLTIRPDLGVFRCPRCGYSGNAWTMAHDLFNQDQAKELLRRVGNYTGPTWIDNPAADIQTRDKVYRALLSKLVLSPSHRKDLLDRGLPEDLIERRRYKSLVGWESTQGICNLLLKEGYPLKGIPGIFQDKYDRWIFMTMPGFFIPIEDENGLIQGFQIRVDDNYRTLRNSQGNRLGKYINFSSTGKKKGCSSGALIHVAVPENKNLKENRVWITEGPLKADIAAHYTNMPFLGVPGVSVYQQAAQKAEELGIKRTAVAYDMDLRENPHVQKAEIALMKELLKRGISAVPVNWHQEYGKGIDDAAVCIANHQIPIPMELLQRVFKPNQEAVLEVSFRLKIR